MTGRPQLPRAVIGAAVVSLLAMAACGSAAGPRPAGPVPAGPVPAGPVDTDSAPANPAPANPAPANPAGTDGDPVPAGRWTSLPPAPLPELSAVTGAWSGRELLVVGRAGRPDGTTTHHAAAYDPATRTWRRLPPPGSRGQNLRGDPVSVWTGRDLVVWGGDLAEAYTPATNSWRHLPHPTGVPFGTGFAMVWTGSLVVLYGGGCCLNPRAEGGALDLTVDRWRLMPRGPLGARWTSGVWTGTEIVFAGGAGAGPAGSAEPVPLADAAAWNPATRRWRSLPPMPAAESVRLVWDGRHVLALGGAVAASYDPGTNSWTRLRAGYDGRSAPGLAWTGSTLLIWGGLLTEGGTERVPPHGLAYDPGRRRWTGLATSPLRGRAHPVVAWTGRQLLVWGGDGQTTGAAWSP